MKTPLLMEEIGALYEADADESLWRTALEAFCRRLEAGGIALLIGHPTATSIIASGVPPSEVDALRAWLATVASSESDTQGAWRQRGGGLHWLLADAAVVAGLSGRHCVVRLDKDGEPLGYLDLYREPRAPDFGGDTVDALRSLAPHVARALGLAMRLASVETSARRCAQCTDMQPFGCLLLDDAGAVIELNCAAAEMLDSGDGLRLADGRLHALRDADDARLHGRVHELLADVDPPPTAFASVPRPSGKRPYVLFMSRIEARHSAFAPSAPRIRLILVDTERGRYAPREVLRALYELTEAESRVAWHLAGGDSLEQAAQRLGIANNTARHYLERIFAKTGVRRQADLVRLFHSPFVSFGGMR